MHDVRHVSLLYVLCGRYLWQISLVAENLNYLILWCFFSIPLCKDDVIFCWERDFVTRTIQNAFASLRLHQQLLLRCTNLCFASPRHQPECLAFRIYLANNIGLLIALRCCHLSSSFSGFSLSSSWLCRSRSPAARHRGKSYFWPDYDRCRSTDNSRENVSRATRRQASGNASVTYI